jgi:hypothetical protein
MIVALPNLKKFHLFCVQSIENMSNLVLDDAFLQVFRAFYCCCVLSAERREGGREGVDVVVGVGVCWYLLFLFPFVSKSLLFFSSLFGVVVMNCSQQVAVGTE